MKKRIILHCDVNNFFASVECALNPSLKDLPVAVTGEKSKRNGIVIAKNNSFKEGYETIHMELIKRICYITGISIKVGYIAMYVFIGLALIWSLLFFIGKCNEYLLVRSIMN